MAKNVEFNSWLSGVAKRTRKKKDVGEGKNFQKGDVVDGARAAYGMSGRAAQRVAKDERKIYDLRETLDNYTPQAGKFIKVYQKKGKK